MSYPSITSQVFLRKTSRYDLSCRPNYLKITQWIRTRRNLLITVIGFWIAMPRRYFVYHRWRMMSLGEDTNVPPVVRLVVNVLNAWNFHGAGYINTKFHTIYVNVWTRLGDLLWARSSIYTRITFYTTLVSNVLRERQDSRGVLAIEEFLSVEGKAVWRQWGRSWRRRGKKKKESGEDRGRGSDGKACIWNAWQKVSDDEYTRQKRLTG